MPAAPKTHHEDNSPIAVAGAQPSVVKKVKPNRSKSAYRDAHFRPLFEALSDLEEMDGYGGTSVTVSTPSHPTYPILHLTRPSPASQPSTQSPPTPSIPKTSAPAFSPKHLTPDEEERTARFWRAYDADLPGLRKHVTPADWRDLSDVAAVEWFHYAVRASGPSTGFTLNLSPAVEGQVRTSPESADWLSKRMARRLKDALGRKVEFWFAFEENDHHRLHVHGELQIDASDKAAARKALRLAGGEWDTVRQHQAHTRDDPSVVWSNYTAKKSIFMRPLKGRFETLDRPINGDWLFRTNSISAAAKKLYTERRKQVITLMSTIKS